MADPKETLEIVALVTQIWTSISGVVLIGWGLHRMGVASKQRNREIDAIAGTLAHTNQAIAETLAHTNQALAELLRRSE